MARKPTDYVQFKIRMREALRRKLERAAELKDISANAEAIERIEATFKQEEQFAAREKHIQEHEEEFEHKQREFWAEQEKERLLHVAALRDSRILNMMVEFKYAGALLLRLIAREIAGNTDWVATPESKKAFADKINSIITDRDFAGDFIRPTEEEFE
jgi:hypothetical protein